jgi:UDP-N-acetylmuramoyl-L-alanyl-D-glutamate--2,6-diaminopimelate ligase
VLVAGKGHETYQVIGDRKLDFSDVDSAAQVLRERELAHA